VGGGGGLLGRIFKRAGEGGGGGAGKWGRGGVGEARGEEEEREEEEEVPPALDSLGLAALGLKPTGTGVNTGASGVNSARFVVAGVNAIGIHSWIYEIDIYG